MAISLVWATACEKALQKNKNDNLRNRLAASASDSGMAGADGGMDDSAQDSTTQIASNETKVSITGKCLDGATITIKGDVQVSEISDGSSQQQCVDGTYSFEVNKQTEGSYNIQIEQTIADQTTVQDFQLIVDRTAPLALILDSLAQQTMVTNSQYFRLTGSCEDGATVTANGDIADFSMCEGGRFTLDITPFADGTYSIALLQVDGAGNSSPAVNLSLTRDTVLPAAIALTSPATSPYNFAGQGVLLQGGCESGATVFLAGPTEDQALCISQQFSFWVTRSTVGTFDYTLTQADAALNHSTPTSWRWVKDSTAPNPPTVSSPAASPTTNSSNSLAISGTCTTGLTVLLQGASTQQTVCNAGAFSFNVGMTTDGSYDFALSQKNLSSGATSTSVALTWIRDTVAPAAPVITSPSTNPFVSGDTNIILAGTCEDDATVALSGDASQSQTCTQGIFSFSISKSVDQTYTFALQQTDRANNASSSSAFEWTRDVTLPATPVLTSPAQTPLYSNASTITIARSCPYTYLVNLTCTAAQSFHPRT
ncbi:hypothetical protein E3A20_12770, partial [Planctomyces bekefii]